MICVSTGNIESRELFKLLNSEELVEIRLDMKDFSDMELTRVFSSPAKTIAACRPGKFAEAERVRKLALSIESGAAFVDLELESNEISFKQISETAKKYNCRLIISHHNYYNTPPASKLLNICKLSSELGADIIKIATYVNEPSDNSKLLSLYNIIENSLTSPLIAIGMGKLGKLTRIAAPYMGAPFTYASFEAGKETAEGQIEKSELEKIYKIIEDE